MREVGVATLAGTLATIIVFVPLVFGSPSEITILMKHVAMPIVIAMVASLLVAQTIIPMLSVRIAAPLAIASGSFVGRLQDRYAAALQWVLGNPRKTGIALLVIIASPVALFATKALKVDPFPQDVGPRPVPRLSHQGHAPAGAGRAGREPDRSLPARESRALRHQERLLALRHGQRADACCS